MCQRSALLQELLREALDARQEDGGQRTPHGGSGGSGAAAAARRGPLGLHGTRHVRALTASERLASTRFQARARACRRCGRRACLPLLRAAPGPPACTLAVALTLHRRPPACLPATAAAPAGAARPRLHRAALHV